MSLVFAEFTERLVQVSDFSQGKAGKIFNDVFLSDNEYIVLKNNQPIAVVVSINEYKETQRKLDRFEKLMETIDNYNLLCKAQKRSDDITYDFNVFLQDEGLSFEELQKLAGEVEIE